MKKASKVLLALALTLGMGLVGIHLIVRYRANQLLAYTVEKVSHGQYAGKSKKVSISYFPAGISIEELDVYPITDQHSEYRIKAAKATIRMASIQRLIWQRNMLVDEVELDSPTVVIHADTAHASNKKPISRSFKDIQAGLFKTFSLLEAKKLRINNGSIALHTDKTGGHDFSLNHIFIRGDSLLLSPDTDNDGIPRYGGFMEIALRKPTLFLKDVPINVQVGDLVVSSVTNGITIDSVRFSYSDAANQQQSVQVSKVGVIGLNWQKFLNEGDVELDTVFAASGNVLLDFFNGLKQSGPKEKATKKHYTGPDFLIHHLLVSDFKYALTGKELNKDRGEETTLQFQGDSLVLENLTIQANRKPITDVDGLSIKFKNFLDSNAKKTYRTTLGSLEASKKDLTVKDFFVQILPGSLLNTKSKVQVPAVVLKSYSFDDLLGKKLVAEKLTVEHPVIVFDFMSAASQSKKNGAKTPVQNNGVNWKDVVQIKELEMNEARIVIPGKNSGDDIEIDGLSFDVNGLKLVNARSLAELFSAINTFRTDKLLIRTAQTTLALSGIRVMPEISGIRFDRVVGNIGPSTYIDLYGVLVQNRRGTLHIGDSMGLHFSDISAEHGLIEVKGKRTEAGVKKKSNKKEFFLKSDRINLAGIQIKYTTDTNLIATQAMDLRSDNFQLSDGHASWDKIVVSMRQINAVQPKLSFSIGELSIDQPGMIEILNYQGIFRFEKKEVEIATKKLQIDLNQRSTMINGLQSGKIILTEPAIHVSDRIMPPALSVASKKNPAPIIQSFRLFELALIDPTIEFTRYDSSGEVSLKSVTYRGKMAASDISMTDSAQHPLFTMAKFSYRTSNPGFWLGEKELAPQTLSLVASRVRIAPAFKQFSFLLDSVEAASMNLSLTTKKGDSLQLKLGAAGLKQMPFNSQDGFSLPQLLHLPYWYIRDGSVVQKGKSQTIHLWGLNSTFNKTREIAFDSVSLLTPVSREEFWQAQPYEKDYFTIRAGKSSFSGITTDSVQQKLAIHIRKAMVDRLYLHPERDKTRPTDTVPYRPLLAQQIASIPLPFRLDTLLLSNAEIRYNEIGAKTKREGSIFFTGLNGYIRNAKNYGFTNQDSLTFRFETKLYDAGKLALRFGQSYSDSLQTFLMRLRLSGPMPMNKLNQILEPLMGIKMKSGRIDSLRITAKGNDEFAFGYADLRYKKMKIVIENKNAEDKYFFSGVIQWVVNLFLPTNGDKKFNSFYKDRVKGKGQFNFLAKMATQSFLANLGVVSGKRKIKKASKKYEGIEIDDAWLDQ